MAAAGVAFGVCVGFGRIRVRTQDADGRRRDLALYGLRGIRRANTARIQCMHCASALVSGRDAEFDRCGR